MTLQQFLTERKFKLLENEKRASGVAKAAIVGQIQALDSVLIFLSSENTEENMAKLQLSLEKQARPLDELKPRQENAELTAAIIDLADTLLPNTYKPVNLPSDVKPKSFTSKVYALRHDGKLPDNIKPITRGKNVYLARKG